MNKLTFLNQPYVKDRSNITSDASFLGISMDSSSGKLKGVESEPEVIRKISQRYANYDGTAQPIKVYNPDRGYILDGISIADAGDITKKDYPTNIEETIKKEIKKILASNSLPLIIGGDHYISYSVISAYDSELKVIHLDAHADYLNETDCLHGSVMRYINNLNMVKQIIHCGIRGNLNSGPGINDSLKKGNILITSEKLKKGGISLLLDHLEESEPVHISFDTDFLDPAIAFATGFPEPEGLDYETTRKLICSITKKANVKGIDFVEYNPNLDFNYTTGIHITNLIMEFLSSKFRR